MKKIILFIFFTLFNTVSAQIVLDEYPEDQFPYKDGFVEMFAEMQNYFVENNLTPCNNHEAVWITLKIDEKGQPFLIKKKSNEKNIEKNKCAFELAGKGLASLKKWQAAKVNGKNVTAYFEFLFVPNHFFDNYQTNYNITTLIKKAEFPGGINAFKKKLNRNLQAYLDWSTINLKLQLTFYFDIDTKGKMTNVEIKSKIPNSEYLHEDIKYAIMKIKDRWNPGLLNEEPIQYAYKFDYTLDVFYED